MIEVIVEQLSAVVYAVLATTLAVGGFLVESAGVDSLLAGQSVLGAWEATIGVLLLVAGVKLVREKLVPALQGSTDA